MRLASLDLAVLLSLSILVFSWNPVLATSSADIDVGDAEAEAEAQDDDTVLLQQVKEWTVANGGSISHKIDIRQIQGSLYGVFANEPILKNEIITSIPWHLLIRPPSGEDASWCEIVETVRNAVVTKAPELQTPYERYLSKRSLASAPLCWSEKGKSLWKELIHGGMFGIYQGLDIKWDAEECGGVPLNDGHLQAMMLLKTRGEGPNGIDLIPINDLLNHRNGYYTNVKPVFKTDDCYMIVATRDIEAGEQLQSSYNQCDWCDEDYSSPPAGPNKYFVTPQIFEWYGFVELYPQRWVVPYARILFNIDESSEAEENEGDEEEGSDLEVTFIVPPSRGGIAFLAIQLERLEAFEMDHKSRTDIPEVELQAIMSFRSAIVTAFENAIEQSEGQLSDQVWLWEEDEWYIEDEDDSDGVGHDPTYDSGEL